MENDFFTYTEQLLKSESPFIAYRLPNEGLKVTTALIDKAKECDFSLFKKPISNRGFIFFPFDLKCEKGWWFTTKMSKNFYLKSEKREPKNFIDIKIVADSANQKKEYYKQFDSMMSSLSKGDVKKVILSRVVNVEENLIPRLANVFSKLATNNPKAFVYIVATPQGDIWTGASPEILLSKEESHYTTVSLAGTRRSTEKTENYWSSKERDEQMMVSSYIDKILNNHNITNYSKKGPYISEAGDINHLKTVYKFHQDDLTNLPLFIEELHPTPALCGEPKEAARKIIKETEKHNRLYYGGFLGPATNDSVNLFVNIRCMLTNKRYSSIFAGGGLTRDSSKEDEWNETLLKCKTLLSAI
ncbi:chorismate-binding protein [Marinilabiliaceae bacterium ANBcel2]|nr:chorismate-binding protein [Marinilabiliaceae bacterium ANBcel2]